MYLSSKIPDVCEFEKGVLEDFAKLTPEERMYILQMMVDLIANRSTKEGVEA